MNEPPLFLFTDWYAQGPWFTCLVCQQSDSLCCGHPESRFCPYTVIKAYGLFMMINTLVFLASPKMVCQPWKLINPSPGLFRSVRPPRTVLATHAVIRLTQAFHPETSVLYVVAYGAAVLGVTLLPVLKDFKDMGIEKPVHQQILSLTFIVVRTTSVCTRDFYCQELRDMATRKGRPTNLERKDEEPLLLRKVFKQPGFIIHTAWHRNHYYCFAPLDCLFFSL
jgi:hypothetical protein